MSFTNILKSAVIAAVSLQLFSGISLAESPKYTVDSSNYMQHADKLTEGQIKTFETYPEYRIDVYASSAECKLPDAVRAVSQTNSKMVNGNEGIEWNTLGAKPFPNPSHAQHYIWNHRSAPHYNASVHRTLTAYIVKSDGTATVGQGDNYIEFPGALSSPLRGQVDPNIYALYMVKNMSPARIAGTLTMLHDMYDSAIQARKAWQYSPATRRVRRAPDVNYDSFVDQTGGLATIDSYNMFTGAQDRFDWTLEGEKTMLIPHANTSLSQTGAADKILSSRHFVDPSLYRYEERNVAIVKATLKEGSRHIFPKQMMYVSTDEHNGIMIRDHYDGQGSLVKHQIGSRRVDGSGICQYNGEQTVDFATRSFVIQNTLGEGHDDLELEYDVINMGMNFYSPDGLRRFAR
ncbi:DUF1329 domain-containing protein [bacterium]|jgi:hypothetical protein|nr:DUF1329 domain-containing protein [bacterium]